MPEYRLASIKQFFFKYATIMFVVALLHYLAYGKYVSQQQSVCCSFPTGGQRWANTMQSLMTQSIGFMLFDMNGKVLEIESELSLSEQCLRDVLGFIKKYSA